MGRYLSFAVATSTLILLQLTIVEIASAVHSSEKSDLDTLPHLRASGAGLYHHRVAPGVDVHWRLDSDNITLAVTVPSPTVAVLAFGIAEATSGELPGSDLALVTFSADGFYELRDSYTLGSEKLTPLSSCEVVQNWHLLSVMINDTSTTVWMTRTLASGLDAAADRPILDDGIETRFIITYSVTSSSSTPTIVHPLGLNVFRAPTLSEYETVKRRPDVHQMTMQIEADFNDVTDSEWSRSACIAPPPPRNGRHPFALAFKRLPISGGHPHHITLDAATHESEDCVIGSRTCGSTAMIWGSVTDADEPLTFPPHVGFNLTRYKCYMIVAHYLTKFEGSVLNVSIFYTYDENILHSQDMILFGHRVPDSAGVHVEGDTVMVTTADSACTSKILRQPVTLYAEVFHTHTNSVLTELTVLHLRGGEVVSSRSNRNEFQSYHVQRPLRIGGEPFVVYPGDEIRLSCRVNVTKATFGLSSHAVMCVTPLHYYPAEAHVGDLYSDGCWSFETHSFKPGQDVTRRFGTC